MSNELALKLRERNQSTVEARIAAITERDVIDAREREIDLYLQESNASKADFVNRVTDNCLEHEAIELLWDAVNGVLERTDNDAIGKLCNGYMTLNRKLAERDITIEIAREMLIEEVCE